MKNFIALLLCIAVATAVPLLRTPNPDDRVEGSYMVVIHPTLEEEGVVDYLRYLHSQEIPFETFHIGDLRGVTIKLTSVQLEAHLSLDDVIEYVEEDSYVTIADESQSCVTQFNAEWGLQRIDERSPDEVNPSFVYNSDAGSGAISYIIDTGIRITHQEFGGRATWGTNTVGDGSNTDCNGHGTHVAGTVGGKTYGVAKAVELVAVKVLSCSGSGTNAGVVQGINWVASDASTKGKKTNANMSLGGGKTTTTNSAVAAAVKAGIVFAVAAGNSNADACNYSPASEPTAITVGATLLDTVDVRSSFSNWGSCVDIFAPGSNVKSAWYTSDTATAILSGTSMASPHVAGVVSLIQSELPSLTPASIASLLGNTATSDVITLNCASSGCNLSPNKLLYKNCDL